MFTTIYFVRHGEVHNPEQVFYGRLPEFRLSERGEAEAEATARFLADEPIRAIFSSPLLRARQTAQILAGKHQACEVRVTPLLAEVKTPFDGQSIQVVRARNWNIYKDVGPEFEQPEDVSERTRQFVAEAREAYAGQAVVAVTHGEVIRLLALWAKGHPPVPAPAYKNKALGLPRNFPAHASVSRFTFTAAAAKTPTFEYTVPRTHNDG